MAVPSQVDLIKIISISVGAVPEPPLKKHCPLTLKVAEVTVSDIPDVSKLKCC